MKKVLLAILAMASITTAHAQLSGNLGLTSDYRFRGISQTQNAPAIQGGIDYAHSSGLYIGNWNSSVSSQMYTNGSGVESDLYGGFKKDIYKGITVDLGTYNYFYPRANVATTGKEFTTNELYAGVGYDADKFGAYTVKYSHAVSDYFGVDNSTGTQYFQADAVVPVVSKLSVVAHAGRTDVANNSALNYNDFNAGLAYDLKGWIVSAKYYWNTSMASGFAAANTINGQGLTNSTAVVAVTRTFE
jgi:uncharacterized protein (TIGR02001 family)